MTLQMLLSSEGPHLHCQPHMVINWTHPYTHPEQTATEIHVRILCKCSRIRMTGWRITRKQLTPGQWLIISLGKYLTKNINLREFKGGMRNNFFEGQKGTTNQGQLDGEWYGWEFEVKTFNTVKYGKLSEESSSLVLESWRSSYILFSYPQKFISSQKLLNF